MKRIPSPAEIALAASVVAIIGATGYLIKTRKGCILTGTYANPTPLPSSDAAAKRIPAVAARLERLWPEVTGEKMTPEAAEISLAVAWLESGVAEAGGGGWWTDKTDKGQGNMVGSGNLGARQCGGNDSGGSYYTCVAYGDTVPQSDGTSKVVAANFRYYNAGVTPDGKQRDAGDAAAWDFINSINKTWPASAELKCGDVMAYAKKQYANQYYQGFGATADERIAGYARAIASHIPAVAAALGHSKVYAKIAPELLAPGQTHRPVSGISGAEMATVMHISGALPRARAIPGSSGCVVWYMPAVGDASTTSAGAQLKTDAQSIIDLGNKYTNNASARTNDPKELLAASASAAAAGAGAGAALGGSIGLAFPPIAPIAALIASAVGAAIAAIGGFLSKFKFNSKDFDYGDPVVSNQLRVEGEKLTYTIRTILDTVPEPGRSILSKQLYDGFVKAGPAVVTDKNGVSAYLGFPIFLPGNDSPNSYTIDGSLRKGWLWPGVSIDGLVLAAKSLQAQADQWIADAKAKRMKRVLVATGAAGALLLTVAAAIKIFPRLGYSAPAYPAWPWMAALPSHIVATLRTGVPLSEEQVAMLSEDQALVIVEHASVGVRDGNVDASTWRLGAFPHVGDMFSDVLDYISPEDDTEAGKPPRGSSTSASDWGTDESKPVKDPRDVPVKDKGKVPAQQPKAPSAPAAAPASTAPHKALPPWAVGAGIAAAVLVAVASAWSIMRGKRPRLGYSAPAYPAWPWMAALPSPIVATLRTGVPLSEEQVAMLSEDQALVIVEHASVDIDANGHPNLGSWTLAERPRLGDVWDVINWYTSDSRSKFNDLEDRWKKLDEWGFRTNPTTKSGHVWWDEWDKFKVDPDVNNLVTGLNAHIIDLNAAESLAKDHGYSAPSELIGLDIETSTPALKAASVIDKAAPSSKDIDKGASALSSALSYAAPIAAVAIVIMVAVMAKKVVIGGTGKTVAVTVGLMALVAAASIYAYNRSKHAPATTTGAESGSQTATGSESNHTVTAAEKKAADVKQVGIDQAYEALDTLRNYSGVTPVLLPPTRKTRKPRAKRSAQ